MSGARVLSLFSGAGGLDLGFHLAGFEIVKAVEIEEKFAETMRANVGPERCFGDGLEVLTMDVADLKTGDLGVIDWIIGGPPCQTFSAAGRRAAGVKGLDDPRGVLFERYVEIVEELKPKGFLYENVYGLVGAQDGEPWRQIKEGFKGAGYKLFSRILDSADYGAPQHRERLIMVGVRNGEFQFPRPTHGPDSLGNRPHFSAGEALLHLTNQQLGDTPFGGTWGHLLPDIPPGLNYSFYTSKLGHPNPVFAWRSKFSDFLYKADPERPVRTIKAQGGKYTGPLHWGNRHFTSDELKLLQSFPEDFVLIGTEAVKRAVIGNSVPPLLSRVLAESVMVQIFNSNNNQGLTWLGEDEKLSFRSLKRQRTEYYAQKALESHSESTVFSAELRDEFRFELDGLVNIVENDESDWKVEIKKELSPSSSYDVLQLHIRNYPCEDGGLSSYRTFSGPHWANYIKRFSEGEASILDAKYDAKGKLSKLWADLHQAESRLKGKITLLPNGSWDVPYSSVEVYCYSEHQESLTSCFKAAELVIRERNRIDDLVQLNGYYQQPNQSVTIDYLHISGNMDEAWEVASKFSKTDLIGKIVPIEEWCDLLSKEPGEVFEIFSKIKLQGFDIRDNHTDQQIEPGKVLVTYAFPTLTTSKIQWKKRLGGMLPEEIAMEIV